MTKQLRFALFLWATVCLLCFVIPGRGEHLTSDSYRFVFGVIQPGWLVLEFNQPQHGNGTESGLFLQFSWSWLFFLVFLVCTSLLRRQKNGTNNVPSSNVPSLSETDAR